MPHKQYVAAHEPPSVDDRILARPFVIGMGLIAVALGIQILVSVVHPDYVVSRAIHQAPPLTKLFMALPLLVGGGTAIAGGMNFRNHMSRRKAWFVEAFGDLGVGAGFLSFGVAVALSGNNFGSFTAQVLIALGLSFWAQAYACLVSERRVRLDPEVQKKLGR